MLRKIFVTALLMVTTFIFSSNICSATVNTSEIYLGGLTFFDKPDKVRKMYREPLSIEENVQIAQDGSKGDIWRYGDSVEIVFYDKSIASITVSSNNGWTTPSGLAVGMKLDDAIKRYGKPDSPRSFNDKGVDVYYYTGTHIPDASIWIVCDKTSHKILKLCVRNYGIPNIGEYNLDGMIKWLLK